MKHFFRTLINLIQALLFLILGAIGIVLTWSVKLQEVAIQIIRGQPIVVFLVGLGFLAIGIALLLSWRQGLRNRYYYVRTGKRSAVINEKLVDNYLRTYWQERFPKLDIESQASLHRKQLQILVHFPSITKDQQQSILTQVQSELEELLTHYLGYHEPFYLMATFGEE